MNQNLEELSNADEAINNPIWKNFMDDDYKALIDKKTWKVVNLQKTQTLLVTYGYLSRNTILKGQ